jgi:low temperature requirement protein LtrA
MIINTTTNQTLGQSIAASGFGFVLVFLTPIFWIMLVITGVMSLVGYYTRHMELGAFAGILIMVAFAMVFPELFWISIVMIVIAGFLVAREVGRAVSG